MTTYNKLALFLITIVLFLFIMTPGQRENTLIFVQVVFRHGNRTPATSYPNDPYKDYEFKPYGQGQLTYEGRKNAYKLGKTLRSLYGSFLGDEYMPSLLHSVSSGAERAQITLQCVHASLFPVVDVNKRLDDGLTWQPIIYEAFPKGGDKYLAVHVLNESWVNVIRDRGPEITKLYAEISEITGLHINNSHYFFKIQNALQVQQEMGLAIPEWTKKYPAEMLFERVLDVWKDLVAYRLPQTAGGLVNLLTDNMLRKIRKEKALVSRRMQLFSGHDLNVVVLLGVLGAYPNEYVNYCAFLAFELHETNNEYYLRIVYQNDVEGLTRKVLRPIWAQISDDPEDNVFSCTLDEFIQNTQWLFETPKEENS